MDTIGNMFFYTINYVCNKLKYRLSKSRSQLLHLYICIDAQIVYIIHTIIHPFLGC